MPTKADYMEIINEKLEDRSSKASKPKEKDGPVVAGPDSDGVDGVSTKAE